MEAWEAAGITVSSVVQVHQWELCKCIVTVTMVEVEATTTMGTMVVAAAAVIMEVAAVDKTGGTKPPLTICCDTTTCVLAEACLLCWQISDIKYYVSDW